MMKPIKSNTSKKFNFDRDKKKEGQEEFLSELSYGLAESINQLRKSPKYLIPFLEKKLACFKDQFIYVPPPTKVTKKVSLKTGSDTTSQNNNTILNEQTPILYIEGKKAVEEAITFLSEITPVYKLTHSNYLYKVASEHAFDIGVNGLISHEGSDGKSLVDRIEKVCDWNGMLSENLEFGGTTAEDILCTWVIDDGVGLRTHRSNLFSDKYKYFGVSVNNHNTEGIISVVDFAEDLYSFGEENPNVIEKTFYLYPSKTDNTKYVNTYLEVDPDAPENTVGVYKSVVIKNINGKASQNVRKIYTLDDGTKIENER